MPDKFSWLGNQPPVPWWRVAGVILAFLLIILFLGAMLGVLVVLTFFV